MELPRNGSVVMFMLVRTTAGRPTGYPMTGLFRDGVLQITTYRKAAKARYLLADDRVCCVVPDPERAWRRRAADRPGRAVGRVRGSPRRHGRTARAIDVPDEVRATVRDRLESEKRMVFRIDVERIEEIGVPA